MTDIEALFIAYLLLWVALFGYLFLIDRYFRGLKRELNLIQEQIKSKRGGRILGKKKRD